MSRSFFLVVRQVEQEQEGGREERKKKATDCALLFTNFVQSQTQIKRGVNCPVTAPRTMTKMTLSRGKTVKMQSK